MEVSLQILSNLSFSQLRPLHIISRSWKTFIEENEASIYRNAAFKAGFISSPDGSLSDAKKYAENALRNVVGWKEICKCDSCLVFAWMAIFLNGNQAGDDWKWRGAGLEKLSHP